ncbi:MAG: hypothetical protein ABI150_05580 [Nitrobacter sp.]
MVAGLNGSAFNTLRSFLGSQAEPRMMTPDAVHAPDVEENHGELATRQERKNGDETT